MTPSTPSGRSLSRAALDVAGGLGRKVIEISPEFLGERILAIEAEAVEAYRLAFRTTIEEWRETIRQNTQPNVFGRMSELVETAGRSNIELCERLLRLIEGENPE